MALKEIINRINSQVEKPLISPMFGDNWRESMGINLSNATLINMAWTQGRRAILLERELIKLINQNNDS